MRFDIDKELNVSIYYQLYNQIRNKIFSGEILKNDQLPSERKLAKQLSVNRSTIVSAYDLLKSDGLIKTIKGKGTFVTFNVEGETQSDTTITYYDWETCFEENMKTRYDEVIRLIMDGSNRSGKCFLAGGLPSPSLIPANELQNIFQQLAVNKRIDPLSHCPVQGTHELRVQTKQLMLKRGVTANINEQLITSGSQQALDLVIRSFIKEGDVVIVEEPTFFGALQLFQHVGAKVITVPMDRYGIKTDVLEYLIKTHHPKIIYTIPNFHNPTGVVMSHERRRKLIELSNLYHVPIIEDDPYAEIMFDELDLRPLKSMDKSNYIIYLSTFSKTISLGLRIGWIVASEEVINCLKKIKQISDLHVNTLNQYVMSEYLASNRYNEHLKVIRSVYMKKRDLMVQQLNEHFDSISFDIPSGGFYLWVNFSRNFNLKEMFDNCFREGVVITPGYHFMPGGKDYEPQIRLNFTYPSEEEIIEGIKRLSKCYKMIQEEGE